MMESRTIAIAGGGIGGLSAALELANKGFRVEVLERAKSLREVGAGLQLSANAVHVLDRLGLGEHLRACATAPDGIRVNSARSGKAITTIPLGKSYAKRYGAPYLVIHRADLQSALANAAADHPDITLKFGHEVRDAVRHSRGLTIQADHNGAIEEIRAIAMIGADGVWSETRSEILKLPKAAYSGRTAWRATIPANMLPISMQGWSASHTGLWLGNQAHLVHYPINNGAKINLVAIVQDDWIEKGWNAIGNRAWLLERFKGWSPEARTMLQTPSRWLKWALCGIENPQGRWGEGPVTLLGDAAHGMLPFLAQGAGMSIEDGAVLARSIQPGPIKDLEEGLRRYERLRRPRVTRVIKQARKNGEIYHLSGPSAIIRNLGMKALGGQKLIDQYDWLYGWSPEAESVQA